MITANGTYLVSTGSREGSGRRMKEVACPTCTVHLQVRFSDNPSFFSMISGSYMF